MKNTEINWAEHSMNPMWVPAQFGDGAPHQSTPSTLFHPQISPFHPSEHPK